MTNRDSSETVRPPGRAGWAGALAGLLPHMTSDFCPLTSDFMRALASGGWSCSRWVSNGCRLGPIT